MFTLRHQGSFYLFTFKLFQLGKFFFPVREVILDVFLNHNAKLRHPELAVGTYGYIGVFKGTFSLKKDSSFASFSPHALKGQKLLAQGCYGHKQHALKGQKLLAQGIALGNYVSKPVAL